jgi:hypothetical protein
MRTGNVLKALYLFGDPGVISFDANYRSKFCKRLAHPANLPPRWSTAKLLE